MDFPHLVIGVLLLAGLFFGYFTMLTRYLDDKWWWQKTRHQGDC